MEKDKQSREQNLENKNDDSSPIVELGQFILNNHSDLDTLEVLRDQLSSQASTEESSALEDLMSQVDSSIELLNQPLLDTNEQSQLSISEAGKEFLKPIVTSTEDDVYAFSDHMSAITVAAAMARLSRRGDDLRITLLDEFSEIEKNKDENLLQRVITSYGDDSVQQLVGQHFVIENASNLLTKKIEWGRLAAYLEQSTRYIYFDVKDINQQYKYVVPAEIEASRSVDQRNIQDTYRLSMDQIFDNYKQLVHELTTHIRTKTPLNPDASKQEGIAWRNATRAQACDAARALLPVAVKSTVGVYASAQATENMIMRLRSDDLLEARQTGDAILEATRQNIGVFLQRADLPDRGGAYSAYLAETRHQLQNIAEQYGFNSHSNRFPVNQPEANLINCNYRSELDLVADMLYESSHLPLFELRKLVENFSYQERINVFQTYIGERLNRRHKPGRALEKLHYEWDILCDYGIFRDLQRHRMVEDLNWQALNPFWGQNQVPEIIEEADLSHLWRNNFDISFDLYNALDTYFDQQVAQYATLLGHFMRWKMSYNGRQAFHIHELRTSPQGHPNYRRLVNMMHQTIEDIHPHLAQAMIFVNQDEDPALTRLAAEKYQQFKLSQL